MTQDLDRFSRTQLIASRPFKSLPSGYAHGPVQKDGRAKSGQLWPAISRRDSKRAPLSALLQHCTSQNGVKSNLTNRGI